MDGKSFQGLGRGDLVSNLNNVVQASSEAQLTKLQLELFNTAY